MTKIEIVREDEKATAILKAIRQIDDGEELEPVVRCKDCNHARINENHPNKPLICFMTKMCGTTDPEWFCGDGERKEGE